MEELKKALKAQYGDDWRTVFDDLMIEIEDALSEGPVSYAEVEQIMLDWGLEMDYFEDIVHHLI